MVGTAKHHRLGPVVPVDKERKGASLDSGASNVAGAGLNEPLGGFIFVCNNDTMREDLERQLFGLPPRYQESVKAIQTGLPLFLYNYSTRSMHGVFEAASDGGFNFEPDAWELKEAKRNGRFPSQVSRFPAQVRVRLREERPPLEESTFHSKVNYYDGPKFRLELTVPEAEELLKLFGTSSAPKTEKNVDDPDGEWERVKVKSKGSGTRVHRLQPTKRPSSRLPVNGLYSSLNGDFGRGGREARADMAHRWRPDPDGWSGSSSAHDEERLKKGAKENGEANLVRAGEYLDPHATNGLCENGSSRADSDGSSVGGDSQLGSQSPNRIGFTSYSAALKAGMTVDVGSDSVDTNGVVESGQSGGTRVGPSVNAGVPSSANADFVEDGSKVGSGKDIEAVAVGIRRLSVNSEMSGSGAQPILGSHNGGDLVWLERKVGKSTTCWDGETKKAPTRSVWSDLKSSQAQAASTTAAAPEVGNRASLTDGGNAGGRMVEVGRPVGKSPSGDGSSNGKKSPTGGTVVRENETATALKGNSTSQGRPVTRDSAGSASVGSDSGAKKTVWQGSDTVLRRLLEHQSCTVSGTPMPVASSGRQQIQNRVDASTSVPETSTGSKSSSTSQAQDARESAGHPGTAVNPVHESSWQSEQRLGVASSGSQTKGEEQGPVPIATTRPANDVQRDGQYTQSTERDEKTHFRRTQSPSPAEASAMIQQRQSGHSLIPARISPPPLPSSHQQFHPDVIRHEMAYRAIPHVEYVAQNGLVQGGWGVPTSVPVISSPNYLFDANGMFSLPPQQFLLNADELHSEILEFVHTASPSAEARSCAEGAIDCVRDAVKRLWPSADVEVFGSYATGLCLSHSDVDVVVVDAPPPLETPETAGLTGTRLLAPSIRLLGSALRDYEWCKSIATIDSATMPVIKLHCRPSLSGLEPGGHVVKIDITIGGRKMGREGGPNNEGPESNRQVNANYEVASKFHNGAAAREYVIKRLHQHPALAPLVLLLKSYLQSKGLKDVYTGGLGSFSLTIMLVFYLERVPIACGTSQEVRAQGVAASNASVSATPSADNTNLACMLPGTESLGSGEEASSSSASGSERGSLSEWTSSLEEASETGASSGAHAPMAVDGVKSGGCNQWTGGIVERLLASMHSVASPNLGILLIGFLYVFGWAIDFTQVRLVTKGVGGSGGLFYHDKASGPVALTIDDPLRPGANIGAGSFNMHRVQIAMQEMFGILTGHAPVVSAERVGMGPGRRRSLPLLDQLFMNGNEFLAPQ